MLWIHYCDVISQAWKFLIRPGKDKASVLESLPFMTLTNPSLQAKLQLLPLERDPLQLVMQFHNLWKKSKIIKYSMPESWLIMTMRASAHNYINTGGRQAGRTGQSRLHVQSNAGMEYSSDLPPSCRPLQRINNMNYFIHFLSSQKVLKKERRIGGFFDLKFSTVMSGCLVYLGNWKWLKWLTWC